MTLNDKMKTNQINLILTMESGNRQINKTNCKYAFTTENTRPVRYELPSINNLTLSTL